MYATLCNNARPIHLEFWFEIKQEKSQDQTERVAYFQEIMLVFGVIQRPRTRSVATRQVIDAHERDLVTNQNV